MNGEEAVVDFLHGEALDAFGRELSAAKTGEDSAVYHRAFDDVVVYRATTGKIPDEAAHEGIARAGRIENFFERICRSGENMFIVKQKRSVLAFFDHDDSRFFRGEHFL